VDSRFSWLCIVGSLASWIAVIFLLMLQLASGYSAAFLGVWTPPNTDAFRRSVGVAVLFALVCSVGLGGLPALRGFGAARWVAAVPAGLAAMAIVVLIFNALVNAFV
jgi:hypothetical protein